MCSSSSSCSSSVLVLSSILLVFGCLCLCLCSGVLLVFVSCSSLSWCCVGETELLAFVCGVCVLVLVLVFV